MGVLLGIRALRFGSEHLEFITRPGGKEARGTSGSSGA